MQYFGCNPFVKNILQARALCKMLNRMTLRPKYPKGVGRGLSSRINSLKAVFRNKKSAVLV